MARTWLGVAVGLGALSACASTSMALGGCADVRVVWCKSNSAGRCGTPLVQKMCKATCSLCERDVAMGSVVVAEQAQSSLSRADVARSALQMDIDPPAESFDAAARAGGAAGDAPANGAAASEPEPSTLRRVAPVLAICGLAYALYAYTKQQRMKHRRRTKASQMRDILADDTDDEEDLPLLANGSARYRGNSSNNLSGPLLDFIRGDSRSASKK